jgi:hypothetical protein
MSFVTFTTWMAMSAISMRSTKSLSIARRNGFRADEMGKGLERWSGVSIGVDQIHEKLVE